ncbi:MAG: hypothetical protein ACP5GJ_02005 [Nanopusillaceae archaeon]
MLDSLFFYVLLLVIFVNIIVKKIERKSGIKEHTKKLQEIQKKYIESIKSGKIDELSKMMEEFQKIYGKIMKHTMIVTIIGIFILIIITFLFQTGFYIKLVDNTTQVVITNPILYNQDFVIYYNNTFLGFYHANNNLIILNGTYEINKLSANVITNNLPFYIFGINWLNPLFLYIILYLLIQIILLIFNYISRRFIKKSQESNRNG